MDDKTIDENIDSQNDAEGTVETKEVEETSTQEDTDNSGQDWQVINKKLFERAKKAEAELKKLKQQSQKPINNNNDLLSDELKLIARGYPDEVIEKAKIIAKGQGIALTEAIKDPLIVTFQRDLDEKTKKENAKLGASNGSSESQEETLVKENMSREEHIEAFKKVMGQ